MAVLVSKQTSDYLSFSAPKFQFTQVFILHVFHLDLIIEVSAQVANLTEILAFFNCDPTVPSFSAVKIAKWEPVVSYVINNLIV